MGTSKRWSLRLQGPVYRFAYRWCGNAQDAEEIAQDTFVRAYAALQGYDAERIRALKLTPWLMTIAVNVARNRVRGKRLPVDDLDGIDEPLASRGDEPEQVSERNDLSDRLAEALRDLPPRYRAAVILRHVLGLSYDEIAEALEQPPGTVKSNVHRGVQLLRERLGRSRSDRIHVSPPRSCQMKDRFSMHVLSDAVIETGLSDLPAPQPPSDLVPNVLYRTGLSDLCWQTDSPIGPLWIAASREGITAVDRAESGDAFMASYRARFGRDIRVVEQAPDRLDRKIARFLDGDRRNPPPFDLSHSTPFEASVLRKALEIPRGQVRPYGWIAQEIGSPKASRAVGSALAGNPVPVLIPCHRVVRGDGVIGNYIFGTEVKRSLLARGTGQYRPAGRRSASRESGTSAAIRRTSSAFRPAGTSRTPSTCSSFNPKKMRARAGIAHARSAARRWQARHSWRLSSSPASSGMRSLCGLVAVGHPTRASTHGATGTT